MEFDIDGSDAQTTTAREGATEPEVRLGTLVNEAVWLKAARSGLEVGPATYTRPREHEIVVRNRAVAINPIDWLLPSIGDVAFPWIAYPFVLGSDVAGEVVEVGSLVRRFRVGDRILGHAIGVDKARNDPAQGAFQSYTVLLDRLAAPLPDDMSFEAAAVLPLGLSTAACGLFQKDHLALTAPCASATPTGKTVLVWGGSTSVGSNAIQLAVAAGYEVIATASPRNFAYVTRLGASRVFDYGSRTVVKDIIEAFKGRTIAGAIAVGHGSAGPCLSVVAACAGDKFVSMATQPVSFDNAPRGRMRALWLVPTVARLLAANAWLAIKARTRGIRTKFIFGTTLSENEVSGLIYAGFLPAALAEGRYAACPEPLVVGRGLGRIPAALDRHRRGVSARKVVVSL